HTPTAPLSLHDALPILLGTIVAQIPLLLGFVLAPNGIAAGVLLTAIGFVTVMSFSVTVVMGQEYLPSRLGIASGVTLGLAIGVGDRKSTRLNSSHVEIS